MKTIETKMIEKILQTSLFSSNPRLAKEYGTTEVTIGFHRNGKGDEIVDFMSYDAQKEIFRCYEIKVTMEDFHSGAKKSWCGNYNYLVLSKELYTQQSLKKWTEDLPDGIGIVVINTSTADKKTVLNPKKKEISDNQKDILKSSLLRTLFYQNQNDNWYLRK